MSKNAKDMIRAALTADTLALGVHWIYDPAKVAELFEPRREPLAPPPDTYHKHAGYGDFTHYGDQTLTLLESVAARKAFDFNDWATRWRGLFENGYQGYLDHATKDTLANLAAGRPAAEAASASTDLSPAARLAPIFAVYDGGEAGAVAGGRGQAALTTANPRVLAMVDFWAATAHHVLAGLDFLSAMAKAEKYLGDPALKILYEAGLESARDDSVTVINGFGASCDAFKMFPGLVHLLAKYGERPREGAVQAILAGGDNAARCALVSTVLAARYGLEFMPSSWYGAVRRREHIEALLSRL